jgi:hypothetical protein
MTSSHDRSRADDEARARRKRRTTSSDPLNGVIRTLQYDEAGLPVHDRRPAFAERVRRLLVG